MYLQEKNQSPYRLGYIHMHLSYQAFKIKNYVVQWTMIAHLGASIMFGDTIIYDAQMQVTLNLKQ